MSTGRIIQFNILVAHLLVLAWIILDSSWNVAGWGLLGILLSRIGGEVYNHRYLAHRSFKLKPYLETPLFFIANAIGVGSSLSFVAIHRQHHKYGDTENDPHSPVYKNAFKVWTLDWEIEPKDIPMIAIRDLLKDKKQVFVNRHYFKLYYSWVAILISLSLVFQSWVPIISFSAIPLLWGIHNAGIQDVICHKFGYRNFETKDNSRNNTLANIIGMGTGLHNNHHAHPGRWNYAVKWWEIDPTSWIIRLIKC